MSTTRRNLKKKCANLNDVSPNIKAKNIAERRVLKGESIYNIDASEESNISEIDVGRKKIKKQTQINEKKSKTDRTCRQNFIKPSRDTLTTTTTRKRQTRSTDVLVNSKTKRKCTNISSIQNNRENQWPSPVQHVDRNVQAAKNSMRNEPTIMKNIKLQKVYGENNHSLFITPTPIRTELGLNTKYIQPETSTPDVWANKPNKFDKKTLISETKKIKCSLATNSAKTVSSKKNKEDSILLETRLYPLTYNNSTSGFASESHSEADDPKNEPLQLDSEVVQSENHKKMSKAGIFITYYIFMFFFIA